VALPVSFAALRALLKELQVSSHERKPLVVGGAQELARVLARELARGGDPSAVRVGDPAGAAVYVHLCATRRGSTNEVALKRARRARVPIVAIQTLAPSAGDGDVPYVLATDIVSVGAGEGLPVEDIARTIAARLGEEAAPLAARLPVLRRAVCERLVESFARKNGIVAGLRLTVTARADLPVLALNQVRMVLRLEQAYGLEVDLRERLPEIVAVVGAGLGLRAVARELLDLIPVAGWAVKGAVAYAGTRTLGEAAIRRLEAAGPVRH
jgi:uncharacterized protein (DUF697 family)